MSTLSRRLKTADHTLQDFNSGCRKDDLKNLTDLPREVRSHAVMHKKKEACLNTIIIKINTDPPPPPVF